MLTPPLRDQTIAGLLLMIAFAVTAPVIDVFAKLTPSDIPVLQVAASRFVLQSAMLIPLAFLMGGLHRPARRELGLHIIRAALILVATGFFFQALRFMPLANAISIFFVEPLILTLLGGLFMGEEIGPRRIIACGIGFLGTLMVIQPSFAAFGLVSCLPLVTAFLFALYMLLTRSMAQKMHPVTLQAYTALAAACLVVPVLVVLATAGVTVGTPVWPSQFGWQMLIGVGVAATLTHLLLSYALKMAPAATLAPLHYLEIAAATVLGLLIFDEFPNGLALIGIVVITASGLFVMWRERQARIKRLIAGL